MRVALEAVRDAEGAGEIDGWKLFLLAPRMLLFRKPGCTRVPAEELRRGGPFGLHLRVLLVDEHTTELLALAAAKLAQGAVPPEFVCALRRGRIVALTKPTGGVRALVMGDMGDVFRRLVAHLGAAVREGLPGGLCSFPICAEHKSGA